MHESGCMIDLKKPRAWSVRRLCNDDIACTKQSASVWHVPSAFKNDTDCPFLNGFNLERIR